MPNILTLYVHMNTLSTPSHSFTSYRNLYRRLCANAYSDQQVFRNVRRGDSSGASEEVEEEEEEEEEGLVKSSSNSDGSGGMSVVKSLERCKRGLSVLPFVEEWLAQGNEFLQEDVRRCISRLRFLQRPKDALEILEWAMITRAGEQRLTDYVTCLDLNVKVRGLAAAAKYFDSLPSRFCQTDIMLKTLLKNYLDQGAAYKAKRILTRMTDLGFIKLPSMHNQLISLYSKKQKENRIPEVLLEMKEAGISPDIDTYNIMMEMRSKKGDVIGMEKLFERMQGSLDVKPNVATFTVLASTYISAGLYDKADAAIQTMRDCNPPEKAEEMHNALITLYAHLGRVDEMAKVWKLTDVSKISRRSLMCMIEAFAKAVQLKPVEDLFLEMEERGLLEVRLANIVINVLTTSSHLHTAESLFRSMIERGCYPDAYTYHHFVVGYLQNNEPDKAIGKLEQCLQTKKSQGIIPLFETMFLILDVHANKGDVESAENLFQSMKRYNYVQNVRVYNTLFRAYRSGMHASDLMNRMALDNVVPDQDTKGLLEQLKIKKGNGSDYSPNL